MAEKVQIHLECINSDCGYRGKRREWAGNADIKYPKMGFGAEITVLKSTLICPTCGEPGRVRKQR